MPAREIDIERRIRHRLTRPQYERLVKDLQGTLRAFDVLHDVAPSLLRELVQQQAKRAHGGSLAAAQAALQDLIGELREHRTEFVGKGDRRFAVIRGGRR
jgi:hypothetical protein